jgi:hypothetical protein
MSSTDEIIRSFGKRVLVLESQGKTIDHPRPLSEQIHAHWTAHDQNTLVIDNPYSPDCPENLVGGIQTSNLSVNISANAVRTVPVTIATSLAPRDIDGQQQAIQSWLNMGFHVISLNSTEELPFFQERFSGVEFVVAQRNAKLKYGKSLVYLDDVLEVLQKGNSPICGIVNSDIHLRDSRLYPFVIKEAVGALVYGARIEVNSLNDSDGYMDPCGFDYFFLDRDLIHYYPKEEYCLGAPWWDFWMPLIALGYNIPAKKLMTHHAFHLSHAPKYSNEILYSMGYTFAQYIPPPFELTSTTMPQYGAFLRNIMCKCSIEMTLDT